MYKNEGGRYDVTTLIFYWFIHSRQIHIEAEHDTQCLCNADKRREL